MDTNNSIYSASNNENNVKPQNPNHEPQSIGAKASAKDKKIDILVIEDDPIANRILSLQLTTICPCNIENVFDLESAMTHLNTPYHIIFTDYQLSDGNIKAFVEKYHQIHPSTPIITITAYMTSQDNEQLLKSGATEILIKPVKMDALKGLLEGLHV